MEYAREKLVTENMALAGFVAKRYRNIGIEWDDLLSLCYLGLVEAATRYEEGKGAFSTIACICMRNIVLKVMRDRKLKKRDFTTIPLETVISDDGEKPLTLEDVLPYEETGYSRLEEADLIGSIRESGHLPDAERKAILMWVAGERQDVIGEAVGFSQSYVSRLIKKGAGKLYAGNYL